MNDYTVLVVEDDPALGEALEDMLTLSGYEVLRAVDGQDALGLLEYRNVDMVLSDVQMSPMDGYTLLSRLRNRFHSIPVIMMTAYGTMEQAVEAMKMGAVDYLPKPFEVELLREKISRYLPEVPTTDNTMIAEDLRTRELMQLAHRVAASEATVMILGESGTGKEVLARYIHASSPRANGPFVAINCAAIPDNMLEAVLFGYEKGAYTGAHRGSPGKFEQAQGGTLLLDEISEMSLPLQAKLLRVLQEREVERLGGKDLIELDVRVLATSNRRLREEVAAGRFREDLYYRLNVFPLVLLPLRERPRDIVPLAEHLMTRHLRNGQPLPHLGDEARAKLSMHSWPGNVRELDNLVQRAMILCNGDTIGEADIHFEALELAGVEPAAPVMPAVGNNKLSSDLRSVEDQMVLDALRNGEGSRKKAAEILGISSRTLRYKIARLKEAGVAIP